MTIIFNFKMGHTHAVWHMCLSHCWFIQFTICICEMARICLFTHDPVVHKTFQRRAVDYLLLPCLTELRKHVYKCNVTENRQCDTNSETVKETTKMMTDKDIDTSMTIPDNWKQYRRSANHLNVYHVSSQGSSNTTALLR